MHAWNKKERLNPASLDPISSHYLSEISLLSARLLTCIMTTYVIKGAAGQGSTFELEIIKSFFIHSHANLCL